jgi:hypothetical protein
MAIGSTVRRMQTPKVYAQKIPDILEKGQDEKRIPDGNRRGRR